jgi:hypothetical protein
MKLTRRRIALLAAIAIGTLYFTLFDTTPRGIRCVKSTSPDGVYIAERCALNSVAWGNPNYAGRLFDAKTGKLLAQHTFSTPVPDLSWHRAVTYSLDPNGPLLYAGPAIGFSSGDGGDDATYISLPPSSWDRLLASRPRLSFGPLQLVLPQADE